MWKSMKLLIGQQRSWSKTFRSRVDQYWSMWRQLKGRLDHTEVEMWVMGLFILFIHFDKEFWWVLLFLCSNTMRRRRQSWQMCCSVRFFGHVTVSCNGKRNITMKESPLGSFEMRGIIGGRMWNIMEGFLGLCRKGLCLGRCRMIRIVREARRSSQTEKYWLFFNVRHHRRSNVLES